MTPPWTTLGIEPTADEALIRKAYAQLVRQYRPDSHPMEFSAVRSAFEEALKIARGESAPFVHLPSQAESGPAQTEPLTRFSAAPVESADVLIPVVPDMAPLKRAMDCHDYTAACAWFDGNLSAARNGSMDAMHDFERMLMQTLLTHHAPPFAFIEYSAKTLEWSTRWPEIMSMIGATACDRLRRLLGLAQDYRFSSQFAANPWQRYLFSPPSTPIPWIGRAVLVERAHKVAKSWLQRCMDLKVHGHLQALNPIAMRHAEGRRLQRCDIYTGVLVSLYVLMYVLTAHIGDGLIALKALLCVAVLLCGCGLRLASRWAREQPKLQSTLRGLHNLGIVVLGLVFIFVLAGHEIAMIGWLSIPLDIFRGLLLVYLIACGLWMQWWSLRAFEDVVMTFKLRAMESADEGWWDNERHGDEVEMDV